MSDDCNASLALRRVGRETPDATALVFPSPRVAGGWESISFRALDGRADRYARGLAAQGVRRGDRVLFLMRPSIEFYAVLYGMLRLGAIPIFVDPSMGLRNVLGCVEQVRPRVVVAPPIVQAVVAVLRRPFASAELFVTAGRRWFWGGSTLAACLAEDPAPFEAEPAADDEQALIAFTSGSTGPPKGVSFTHGMINAQVEAVRSHYGWGPGHTIVMGFAAFVLLSVGCGSTTVVPDMDLSRPARVVPERIVEAVAAQRADHALASPIVWMKVTRYCQKSGVRLPGLRQVVTLGAPIQADLHRRFREILDPGSQLFTPYGATEALPVTNIGSDEVLGETWARTAAGHGTCVGRPFPGVRVHVMGIRAGPVEQWSEALELPQGEIGELVVDAPIVSPAYVDRPDANARAKIAHEGRTLHRLDDLGYVDEQGRVWFCGRVSHRLETAAGMVPAVAVEGVYNEHPRVFRTALVGVGEPGAELPVLLVEVEPGEAFDARLERELAELAKGTRWEGLVRQFLVHPGFPVDPRHNSKIRREELRGFAAARVDPRRPTLGTA